MLAPLESGNVIWTITKLKNDYFYLQYLTYTYSIFPTAANYLSTNTITGCMVYAIPQENIENYPWIYPVTENIKHDAKSTDVLYMYVVR